MVAPFRFPYIAGKVYDPGTQPYKPGVTHTSHQTRFGPIPWPNVVNTISALASSPGFAAMRGPVPVVDRYAFLPANNLFISGFVGKSQG